MKELMSEFKKFISKGNVLDLAVGVIIGGAFQKIVSSLVNDILMPILGIITGGHDFTKLTLKVKDATINYGMFIQNIFDFIIIKIFNKIKDTFEHKNEKKEEITKTNEELLLTEIRDLLKGNKKKD